MTLKELVRWSLTSGPLLCLIDALLMGFLFFMYTVHHKWPSGPYAPPVVIAGGVLMCFLGWYNAERGTSRGDRIVGLVVLYTTMFFAVIGLFGI